MIDQGRNAVCVRSTTQDIPYPPKTKEYPEETNEWAIKMYLSRVNGREVGKMLGMSKASVYNWT